MKKNIGVFSVAVAGSLFVGVAALAQEPSHPLLQTDDGPDYTRRLEYHRTPRPGKSGPQPLTLFASQTHRGETGWGRSAFNFNGIRSDDKYWPLVTHNKIHLVYGIVSIDHDADYFSVSQGGDDLSRIKDLGAMQWTEVTPTPVLPLPQRPKGARIPKHHESFEVTSDGRTTKAVAGHMYLVHFKDGQEEFYAMFRVDSLEPNDRCTLSWKVVSPPKP
jgi:hypothetical protein